MRGRRRLGQDLGGLLLGGVVLANGVGPFSGLHQPSDPEALRSLLDECNLSNRYELASIRLESTEEIDDSAHSSMYSLAPVGTTAPDSNRLEFHVVRDYDGTVRSIWSDQDGGALTRCTDKIYPTPSAS